MGKEFKSKAEGDYSRATFEADVTDTATSEKKANSKEEKQPFRITVVENEDFNSTVETKYITSNDFCKKVSQLLRSVFSDYEACDLRTYKDNNTGVIVPQLHLFFNHNELKDDSRVNAITRDDPMNDESRKTSSDTVNRFRSVERAYRNGDKYFLTQDGMDALLEFFPDFVTMGRRGRIDFSKYVSESTIPTTYYNGGTMPATHVAPIDPAKFAAKIYGETDEDGKNYIYAFQVGGSIPTAFGAPSNGGRMACTIVRVSEDNVAELSNQLGINYMSGGTLVR